MASIICFEGSNGTGKTTQSRALQTRLAADGCSNVFLFHDPGITPGHQAYETLRVWAKSGDWKHGMTRLLLYMAARCELVAEITKTANEHPDAVIILDRFVPGFYAYGHKIFSAMLGEQLLPGTVGKKARAKIANLLETCGMITPDLTVFLFCNVELAARRAAAATATPDVYEKEGLARHVELDAVYQNIASDIDAYPFCGKRACVVDIGSHADAAVADVHTSVYECLVTNGLIPARGS